VPEVSVVIAAYNQARWLGEAIETVRAQTFTDWELVIVDDGSTDLTPAVVAPHRADVRIRYVQQPHAERMAARNRGIAASTGPLVAFLDADDRWLPTKLERQVAALADAPEAALCYTPARFIDELGRHLPLRKPVRSIAGDVFGRLLRSNVIILASVLARRRCIEAVGAFDERLPVHACEDWDLWLRLARRWPVAVVDEELTLYRRHGANTAWEQVLAGALAVIDKTYADPETKRRAGLSRAASRALHYWTNAAALADAEPAAARRLARRALGECPPAALSRPAAATLAGLLLPQAAVRALRRLAE
jgi:glycosyltransferase involved in cell wall biosynthesis